MKLIDDNKRIRQIEGNLFSSLYNINDSSYDNKARFYEKLVSSKTYNQIIWGTLPSDYTDFAQKAILNSNGTSLDIGCGGLIQTASIYAASKQNCILLDHSIEMLKIANNRLITLCHKIPENICLLQANAFQLPFDNDSFDNVVSFGMIHCFENKAEFITEALRVLKPAGTFYFTTMTSDRLLSKYYMNLLRKQKEFGEPINSEQILNLFEERGHKIEYFMKGSMIFIRGTKSNSCN